MSSETVSSAGPADVTIDVTGAGTSDAAVTAASDAAEQMAAATQALRERFPMLQTGDGATTEPYPA